MPRFAIYYVPQADDPFYRTGSQIIGYDLRARSEVPSTSLQESLGQLSADWTTLSGEYGLHLTITEAMDCDWATIPRVERELSDLLACFDPQHPFILKQNPEHFVYVWKDGSKGSSIVLRYNPNEYFYMLHTLLVARIAPIGQSSDYLKRLLAQPDARPLQPHEAQQLRLFSTPRAFDNWYPHFTLLNPYQGGEEEVMAERLGQLFAPYKQITLGSICLLIRPDDAPRWHIYREFHR